MHEGKPAEWMIGLANAHAERCVVRRMTRVVVPYFVYDLAIDHDVLVNLMPQMESRWEPPCWWNGATDSREPPLFPEECQIRLPYFQWDPFQDTPTREEIRKKIVSWRDIDCDAIVDAELQRIEQTARAKGGRPTPRKRRRHGNEVTHFRWAALFQCGNIVKTSMRAAINDILNLVGLTPRRGKIGRPRKSRG